MYLKIESSNVLLSAHYHEAKDAKIVDSVQDNVLIFSLPRVPTEKVNFPLTSITHVCITFKEKRVQSQPAGVYCFFATGQLLWVGTVRSCSVWMGKLSDSTSLCIHAWFQSLFPF